ncbi:MAG: glycoside hydrolase family 9 protein [Verrucomicrobiota bacterium]|nr:glycoside hydrolase family 9 protein [Verrucomicrobiota bacterium]
MPTASNPTPIAHSQLGYRPGSPRWLTLPACAESANWPERIPFYVRNALHRLPRTITTPEPWNSTYFRWPYDLMNGTLQPEKGKVIQSGELRRIESRWGTFWQGQIEGLTTEAVYQVETQHSATFPFQVWERIYDRLPRGFLIYLRAQRSGMGTPGVRDAHHVDDAVLDTDRTQIAASGGWNDAGDHRKWMFLTQPNLMALADIVERGLPSFREDALAEIAWGNKFFHSMISPEGQVWEDVGGGTLKAGIDPVRGWWFDNHPGCNCNSSGGPLTDNIPGSGDERLVRTFYNPFIQYYFVQCQARLARVLPHGDGASCRILAERAWRYGQARGHDGRTLFLAGELGAAIELLETTGAVEVSVIEALATRLLERQVAEGEGLHGYFMEAGDSDGYRSIAFSAEPALVLLRLATSNHPKLVHSPLRTYAAEAVCRYIEGYVLADARSNPFGIGPYGVYVEQPHNTHQLFRDAGRGRGVRTFIHPYNWQQIVHGTHSVVAHQAWLLAWAATVMKRPDWRDAAERMLQWSCGHNPEATSLFMGFGCRHPTPFSAHVANLPEACVVGHIGRPDDTPYLDMGPLIEWSTQEVWDVPHAWTVRATAWL